MLAVALALLLTPVAQAQVLLAARVAVDDKAVATMPGQLTVPLDEARAQLTQARHLRDEAANQPGDEARMPLAAYKQRLLDWLVDLRGDKVKRIEELLALQNTPRFKVGDDLLVQALDSATPHSALQVDALRDEIDGLKESLAAAEASFRATQTEMQDLQGQLKSRAAAARLVSDPPPALRSDANGTSVKDKWDVADLQHLTAETELAVTALTQQSLKLRIAALSVRIEDLEAVVGRVLPSQRLSGDDLATQRQRVRAERDRLTAETILVTKRYAQHRAERDRLDARGQALGADAIQQAGFLESAVKTDNAILKGLDDLQVLTGVSGDSWEQRYVVSSGADPEQRRAALTTLRELQHKLTERRSASHARQEALRTEIREQRMRIDNLGPDGQAPGGETARLDLLLQQAAMDERVELAATRLERQVSRWLADFDDAKDDSFGRAVWLGSRVKDLLARVWQQELFVAEDVSEVDGRRVSVQYGVTVGKSIGIVAVFALGYWLLSRLSRFVQHQMVRRLKVSHQLASVTRRWSMIVLCIALGVLVLNLARVPLSVFAFFGGALAIGVGFGAQTVIKNFISGLIVLLERKVRVGDVVELGGIKGRVTAVDLRATTVQGDNGEEALIPNANFVENQVVNWTYSNQQVRRELQVGVAYGCDLGLTEALFLAAAAAHAHVLSDPAPEVFFEAFGDSALTVVLVYWVELDSSVSPRRIASDLRHDIYQRLATAGIAIPFPQREVHVKFAESVAVRSPHERHWRPVHAI
jgi:potassium-dependent mechanosensitive channel